MEDLAIAVFTNKSVERILAAGGSGAWLLNPRNARRRRYLVCVRNSSGNALEEREEHGAAFLVGEIRGVEPLPEENGIPRWQVSISRYALVDKPGVWRNRRNPVWYTTLADLGIDVGSLTFEAVPQGQERPGDASDPRPAPRKLTLAEAKAGLAATFGVRPEAIEIIIRG